MVVIKLDKRDKRNDRDDRDRRENRNDRDDHALSRVFFIKIKIGNHFYQYSLMKPRVVYEKEISNFGNSK
jgi:hypothetical protein